MTAFDAWWLPDGETHLQGWMAQVNRRVNGRLTYQYEKYETALGFCQQRRGAIDVGAHVGLWSYWLAEDFQRVYAFEPHDGYRECWAKNVQTTTAKLFPVALGDVFGRVGLETPSLECSGGTHTVPGGDVPQLTLDAFHLSQIDFLKMDCEGYEANVVTGGIATLLANRPVIIVEQANGGWPRYGHQGDAAVRSLVALGAVVRANLDWDFVLTFPEEQ